MNPFSKKKVAANIETNSPKIDDEHDIATTDAGYRFDYINDYLDKISIIMFMQYLLIGLLIFFIGLQIVSKEPPAWFPMTKNLQLIRNTSLDKRALNDPVLLNWVTDAVMGAFHYNYRSVYRLPEILAEYFDDRAMKSFLQLLERDKFIKRVVPEQMIVSAEALSSPEIEEQGPYEDGYVWQVSIPIKIKFENRLNRLEQEVKLTLLVWRVPETDNPIGVRITSINREITRQTDVTKRRR